MSDPTLSATPHADEFWGTDRPTTVEEALQLLRFGGVLEKGSVPVNFDMARTERRMLACADFFESYTRSAGRNTPKEPMCECDELSKHPLNSNDLRAWKSLAYDLEARLEKACDAYGEAHGRAAEMAESIKGGYVSTVASTSEPGRIPDLHEAERYARYWIDAAKTCEDHEEAMIALHQAVCGWKNAAYAMADQRDAATRSATASGEPNKEVAFNAAIHLLEQVHSCYRPSNDLQDAIASFLHGQERTDSNNLR